MKKGKSQKLYKCCREIRIQGGGMKLNETYSGFNTMTNEEENWMCIKVSKNQNDNILVKILS